MMERLFPKYHTGRCWKVLIECMGAIEAPGYRDLLGVYAVQIKADAETFLNLSSHIEKKQWAMAAMSSGIVQLIAQAGWDAAPFEECFEKMLTLRLNNEWVWKKAIPSPCGQLSGKVLCRHGVERFDILLIVEDKAGRTVAEQLCVSEQPDEFAYARHLGCLRWANDHEVVLESRRGTGWSLRLE